MRILVTGGTGSFGHTAVARFLKRSDVERVIVYSRDEKKQHDMRHTFKGDDRLSFVVGDVRDRDALWHLMRGIDVVFHAAALKQVPTGEFFPWEMVKTNVLGSHNIADVAENVGVGRVIFLSTDKAVHPVNAMGMSKALAEKTMTAFSRIARNTVFCAVRYGNVAASRGSVIPLFVECIKARKPLPITVPHMTRFLLSLDDAVNLVELAMDEGKQGNIFIKKSPAATIQNLAVAIKELFKSDVQLTTIGIREGEKIHEILAHNLEIISAEDLGDFFRIRTDRTFDYQKYFEEGGNGLPEEGHYASNTTQQLTMPEIKKFLLSLPYIQEELRLYRA